MNPWKLQIGQRVLVNTRGGDALDGIVRTITGKFFELSEPHLTEPRTGRGRLDGLVKVPNDWVAWIQVVSS